MYICIYKMTTGNCLVFVLSVLIAIFQEPSKWFTGKLLFTLWIEKREYRTFFYHNYLLVPVDK